MWQKLQKWWRRKPLQLAELQQQLTQQAGELQLVKQEAQRLSNAINSSLNPIWQRRAGDMKIIYCNLAFSEITEETTDQVMAIGDLELFKGHKALSQRAWDSGQEQTERRHIVVGGERLLYAIREVPFKSDGLIYGWAVNISDLERAEEEIQLHVSSLRDLLESSISAMAIYAQDMRLKFYNFAFVSLWKLDEDWLDTEPTYGEILEMLREKRKLPEQANFQAFKQAQIKQFTTLIERDEGFFYLPDDKILRVIAIPHALGGVLSVYEDVTDRLALERSYNTLIAVQRETLDNLHEGVVVFGENGRLSLSNPVFHNLWSIDEDFAFSEPHMRDVLEKFRPFFVASDWEQVRDSLLARLHARQLFALRLQRNDQKTIDCAAVPLPDGATLLTFTDITDSTLVERSLREKNEALMAADHLKTEFLANMSYELRSPLTSISGFAEMLARNYLGELSPQQHEYVSNIYQSAQHLGGLISDILDLATIEAGYLQLDITAFDPQQVIAQVQANFTEKHAYENLQITCHIDSQIKLVNADENRFKQILFNLLSNAAKQIKNGGILLINLQQPTADLIELAVYNPQSGPISAQQAQVFEPFFRSGSRQGNAAGLGLSIVKRFVQLHGGNITLRNADNGGSEVVCSFPQKPLGHIPHAGI